MENAVEALKMAFAVIVFVIALSVSIVSFNKAKETSDIVLYAKDETNFYEYYETKGRADENRIVGLEAIVPTLYKYYKENYTVLFRQGTYNLETGEFSKLKYLPIYETPSKYKTSEGIYLWGKRDGNQSSYDTLMQKKYNKYFANGYGKNQNGNKEIFSFDLEEETLRHEPWTGSYEKIRENIARFLSGDVYNNPNNNSAYIDYEGFIEKYSNRKFVETVGEYTYSSKQSNSDDTEDEEENIVKEKKKRIIIFTLID